MNGYDFTTYASTSLYDKKGRSNMVNLGNSCYFNATMAALTNCLGLTHFFLGNKYTKVLGPANMEKPEYGYLMKYIAVLVGLFEENQTVAPKSLYNKLSTFVPDLKKGQQNDAHECLFGILNVLHIANSVKLTQYNIGPLDTKVHSYLVDSRNSWIAHFKDDYSIINHLFFGQYIQKLQCTVCNHTSYKYEPFIDLSVAVPSQGKDNIHTIYNLLDDHFKNQIVENDCEGKCNKKTKFNKKTRVIKMPKYLIIHFKRFNNDLRKVATHIAYSSDLEMSKFSVAVENQSVEYNLISVINHSGVFGGGHYYTYNRLIDGNWVNIDDDITTDIKPIEVCNKDAYCLIYELDVL